MKNVEPKKKNVECKIAFLRQKNQLFWATIHLI